ncbi:MAG TPA: aminotransferase class III-fold pyridoxal phosphate-dependent enzyme [Gemmatimonadales bacterium]|nr:aminotransferase class III-fold pyridoxal phosphate-dependent enzyme [Gemmatimonadales bacterium]
MLAAGVEALLPVYAQMPVRPVSGRGAWLVDEAGAEWLDAYGGHAVASTGHCHPRVVEAIAAQAAKLMFYSTAVPHPLREQLAAALVARCPAPLGRVFFCNSGAEANENALLLARKATGRRGVASVTGGWHGRTVATLACSDGAVYEAGALRAGMALSTRVAFDDVESLERTLDDTMAALIVEPVQGMAGARQCSPEFLAAARRVCTERGIALLFDEVQCGVGRSGAFTAAELYGVAPDGLTLAKGLASGYPIGAVIAGPMLSGGVGTGDLGSTFGGGPVACAAALATLAVLADEDLAGNAARVGAHLATGARALGARKVWGHGLLRGLDFGRPAKDLQQGLFARRILSGTSADPNVLRLMPPLTLSVQEADVLLAGLREELA